MREAARILRNTTLLEAERFETSLDAMGYQVRLIGNAFLLNHTVTSENKDRFLDEELKQDWLDGVIVFDERGDFVAQRALFPLENALSASTITQASFRDRAVFKQLRLREENDSLFYWQSQGTDPNIHGFAMYHAVRDAKGKFLGGVVGYFDSRSMVEIFRKLNDKGFYLGSGGAMVVLDRDNCIQLTRVGAGITVGPLHFNPYIKEVMKYSSDSAQTHQYISPIDGTSRIGVFLNLSHYKWVIAVGLAKHEILFGWYMQAFCTAIALIAFIITQWSLLNYVHANSLQRAQLVKDALRDSLTGLANRRYFDEQVRNICRVVSRRRQSLCMLNIDLDYFKKINDNFGHSGGDEVLRRVGQILPGLVRGNDIVARLGGEEFVVVMPFTQPDYAKEVAERIRVSFANQVVDFQGRQISFTASFGLAQMTPDELNSCDDFQAALDRADQALYRAKREGRNRVCVASNNQQLILYPT
ncbi:sensor domain-containing diguanylate cyclase [Citrobacter sp. NCU1]|uniref:sensor domain-containing diguanylate cyclase n=1 Tax=Citrobacter sp. NCU1 TaxID=2026683 RepID=UPI001EE2B1B7|nr:sensor domain-containing diguanylate cyclase [Citrobacter sp. NCU1]